MKKRTKKLLSLLLALVMLLSLAPLSVFAEDDPAPADPVVTEEPAEEPAGPETGTVMVVVYSKATGDFLDGLADVTGKKFFSTGLLRDNILATGKPILEDIKKTDADAETPELMFALKDGSGNIVSGLQLDETVKGSEIVSETITGGKGDLSAGELDKIDSSRFKVFKATVPAGTYTLELLKVVEPYGLAGASSFSIDNVEVSAGETTIVGETKKVSGFTEQNNRTSLWDKWETTYKTLSFTGLFFEFRKETRAFSFTTTDVAGAPVQGSEFVLVNRDELLGLMKPIIGVGKEVFTTAVKNLGNPDVFSFEELVQLHTNLLKQNEQGYIAIDPEAAFGIVKAYLALLTDADIVGQFVEKDENGNFVKLAQPLPAVLSATSDENGVVYFSAESNVTLTWLITIITDFGADILEGLAANNPLLQALLPLVKGFQIINHIEDIDFNTIGAKELIDLLNVIPDFGNESFSSIKNTILSAAENNAGNIDTIMNISLVRWGIEQLGGILVGAKSTILNYVYSTLQNYGIVGEKFSNGNYLLFQYKAPEEYARNPLVYTLNIKWTEPDNFYVTVVDLGLVGPYFAEGFYEFVRNTTFEGPIATALGITANNYGFASKLLSNQIDLTKKVNQQVQGAFSAYAADTLYKALGLDLIFNSKLMLMEGINDYLLDDKNAAANLRAYVNAQAKRAKSVYTSVVDEDWVFYTLDASPTTTATKLINKSTEDIAATMPNGSAKQLGVKETGTRVAKIVQTIGTRIEATNAKIVESVKAAVTKVFGDIGARIKDGVKNIVASLFSTIFGGGTNNTANA